MIGELLDGRLEGSRMRFLTGMSSWWNIGDIAILLILVVEYLLHPNLISNNFNNKITCTHNTSCINTSVRKHHTSRNLNSIQLHQTETRSRTEKRTD